MEKVKFLLQKKKKKKKKVAAKEKRFCSEGESLTGKETDRDKRKKNLQAKIKCF